MSITKNGNVVANQDGSVFQGYEFNIGKTIWGVVTRTLNGETKTVTVSKLSPNPWWNGGKEFDSFDEAVGNYKNPTMKMNLRLIENF